MCNFRFFLCSLTLVFLCNFDPVRPQFNESSISGIFDVLEVGQLETLYLTGISYIESICQDIKKSEKDDLCTNQLKIVCNNETFRWRMLDASSKFPYSGLFVRTRIDYGSYDECINLDLTENGTRVMGKHCTGGLFIPATDLNDTELIEKGFKLSICIPNECSSVNLMDLFEIDPEIPIINDLSCATKASWKQLGADDYAAIAFFAIVSAAMVFSTICDVYLFYANKECSHILLRAFSMFHNGKKLLQVSTGPSDQIKVIHGLRVISMMWIVTGHSFSTMQAFPGVNVNILSEFEWSRKSAYITSAHLAVDTFFFISGFLLAYQYLKQEAKPLKTHIKRVPYFYLHRYLRITPAAAAAFIFAVTLLVHIGDGPIYHDSVMAERDRCIKYWWSFFLYVQNYVNYDYMCISSTWYLSADWQLFLIAPIILIPVAVLIKRNFAWTMGQLFLLNISITLAPVLFKILLKDFNNLFETHVYLNDYFIGFTMGVFMRAKINMKYKFNAATNLLVWSMVLILMPLTLLAYKEIHLLAHIEGDQSYTTYLVFVRAFWCIGLCWIIYSCHNGYGGIINWMLTTPFVQVLSKLTYCIYISHVLPIMYIRLIARVPMVYSQITAILDAMISYFFAVILSVVWTLAFESPIITLEKHFLVDKR